MNTKEVCQRLSVTPKMLRVYEKQKLLQARRRENNYRDYDTNDMLRIQIIVLLKKLGFSLKDIKSILNTKLSEQNHLISLYMQMKAVETQIESLEAVHGKLINTINRFLQAGDADLQMDIMAISSYISEEPEEMYEDILKKWDFDKMAANYVERYLKEDKGYLWAIHKIAEILSNMEGSFVDVGAGTCNLWEEVNAPKQLLVIDKSLQMILAGKEKIPWAQFAMGDILQEDRMKKMGSFDVVVSTFTLHHIPYEQQMEALKNLMMLCNDGGKVVIADRYFENFQHKQRVINMLEKENDTDQLNRIIYEFYLFLEEFEQEVPRMGGKLCKLFHEEDTCGFIIEKG